MMNFCGVRHLTHRISNGSRKMNRSGNRHCAAISLVGILFSSAPPPVLGEPQPVMFSVKQLSMDLARDIANEAVLSCRKRGYQVSAVVVDRAGIPVASLRDTLASQYTLQISRDKAGAVVLSGVPSGEFRRNRDDIRQELDHVEGILLLPGGVPIQAAGSLLGAVAVSGAPGGEIDEACAAAGIASVQERLDFAE